MAFSGGVAIASGLYRCADCRGVARLDAGEVAPPCPACRRSVTWLYLGRAPFPAVQAEPAVRDDERGVDDGRTTS
jgi:hypothetical protein